MPPKKKVAKPQPPPPAPAPAPSVQEQAQPVVGRYKTRSKTTDHTKANPIHANANHEEVDLGDTDTTDSDITETDTETDTDGEESASNSDATAPEAKAEYLKFLASIFPSSYMTERANDAAANANTTTPERHSKRKLMEDEAMDDPRESKLIKSMLSSMFNNDNMPAAVCIQIVDPARCEHEHEHEQQDPEDASTPTVTHTTTAAEVSAAVTDVLEAIPRRDRKLPAVQKIIDHIQECLADRVPDLVAEKEKLTAAPDVTTDEQMRQKHIARYRGLLQEKNFGDLQYFADKLSLEEQRDVLEQMQTLKLFNDVKKPYGLLLLESKIPLAYKAVAMRKIRTLRMMEPGAGEYFKLKNWVDAFMRMPFGVYKGLPVSYDNGAGAQACQAFMTQAKATLDEAVFGLDDAKMQIMQMLGQWLVNPNAIGTAIAIKGPMGTGKTTLVKEGISKILGRDFAFVALGGATDSAFLEGHSYTYEGSKWGYIVDILLKCQSMNPIIYFDELDKVSNTPKGEDIIGILTHLTDTSQNSCFHDRYFTDIDFDLSRCLFIFSYNDESKVNPILLDRMYRIHTKGYGVADKQVIARQHLLPTIRQQLRFGADDIVIPDETVDFIANHLAHKEDGVRNLKRCLEIIHTKLNLLRMTDASAFGTFFKDLKEPLKLPIVVTPSVAEQLIKRDEQDTGAWRHMYS